MAALKLVSAINVFLLMKTIPIKVYFSFFALGSFAHLDP